MSGDALLGFLQAIQPASLVASGIGAVLGLVVGMIPGMTISTGIIIVLPLTFVLSPDVSIALLLALYAAGMTGGSFAAILINIPGTPSAAATAADGYALSMRGEAGLALGVSILASFVGGLFSFFCLLLISPLLAAIALEFRAPDLFSLVLFGLTLICSFAARSLVKGLLSAVIGLVIVTVGQDPMMGTARFTFGSADMLSGIQFLTAMIGLFAIPQLATNLAEGTSSLGAAKAKIRSVIPPLSDLKRMRIPVAIGSVIGSFVGLLPGTGGPIAAFIAYDYTMKASRDRDQFGKGAVEGVAAPEAANNAVTGGALVPMMTLGIPGDPVTAILMGALLVHGLTPGPLLFLQRADFAYGIIFSFFWANVLTLIVALLGLRLLVKLLATPRSLLMPIIAVLCVVGSYALRNSFFDVYVMFFFGILGLLMRWLNIPVVPLLLALVLGNQFEEHLRVALTSSQGDITIFFTSPFSLLFLCLAVVSVVWSLMSGRRAKAMEGRVPGGLSTSEQ